MPSSKTLCYFCKFPGVSYDYPFWRAFKSNYYPEMLELNAVYFGEAGNVWACAACRKKEAEAFKDRGFADPAFGDYEGECIYAHACSQDNTGVTSCLVLMDWQQGSGPDPNLPYPTQTWDRVCLPCQAYYECAVRDDALLLDFSPRPVLAKGQIFS